MFIKITSVIALLLLSNVVNAGAPSYPSECVAENFIGKFTVVEMQRCDGPFFGDETLLEINGKPDMVPVGAHYEPGVTLKFSLLKKSGYKYEYTASSPLHDDYGPTDCHRVPVKGDTSMIISRPYDIRYPVYALYHDDGIYSASVSNCHYLLKKE